jgi:predicted CXXCH cytochrome family protein
MKFTYPHLLACFIFMIFVAIGATAFGASVCFECHERSMFKGKLIHEPVARESCISCHNPHAAKHAGLLNKEVSELCFSCHGEKEGSFTSGIVHVPVRRGQCNACHEPHASATKGLMKGKFADSCFNCHESLERSFKYMHEPYAKGRCQSCHSPHNADNYQLLNVSAGKLCQRCHTKADITKFHRNYPVAINTCLSCHNPHGSNNKKIIRNVRHAPFTEDCTTCHEDSSGEVSQEICLDCHDEINEFLLTSHNHLTDAGGNSCINCHSPHAGDTEKLLKNRQVLLCRSCHDDVFTRHEDNIFAHTATANDCQVCHTVHGTNQVAMLKGDANSVCLGCHPNQGQFSHPVGAGIIDPRNNLEATCLSCHHPHGTDFRGQLRMSGQEELCKQCHYM